MPTSTVSAVLRRHGMGRLGRLGWQPARRYERARPGELIHVDVEAARAHQRRGGQGRHRQAPATPRTHTDRAGVRRKSSGWECVHVAIDDATRLAYAEVLADETAERAVGFLERAVAFYRAPWRPGAGADDR